MSKSIFIGLVLLATLAIDGESGAKGLPDYLRERGVVKDAYYPDISVRGRLHLDAGWHDDDNIPFADGVNTRRARMGLSGGLDADWSFTIEYDFAEEGISAADVSLSRRLGNGVFNIGHFKVPMGLNELTSSNHITFIERAANNNVIVDSRRIGIGYDYHAGLFGVQLMAYSRAMGDSQEGDMPLGIGARTYMNPIRNGDWMLHLGLSTTYENRRDYDTLRFRDRPEARADAAVRLIDTADIENVDYAFKNGMELAVQLGPLSLEAEYLVVDIDYGLTNPQFSGYHVQLSYILTGESRGYESGVFRGVTPSGSMGAWETAVRWSSIDLNDAGIRGGKQDNLTLGVNYYATADVRFMANYIFVDVTDSNAEVNGVVVNDDAPNILMLRAQYHF